MRANCLKIRTPRRIDFHNELKTVTRQCTVEGRQVNTGNIPGRRGGYGYGFSSKYCTEEEKQSPVSQREIVKRYLNITSITGVPVGNGSECGKSSGSRVIPGRART